MLDATPPEMVSADLAPLALQLASWGCPEGQGLAWLDAPDPAMLGRARELLLELCAVDEKGALTVTGVCVWGGCCQHVDRMWGATCNAGDTV